MKPLDLNVNKLIADKPKPDYTAEVLRPLYAAQAKRADELRQAELKRIEEQKELERKKREEAVVAASRVVQAAPTSGDTSAIKASIVKWANYYSVDSERLLRVGACESGYHPNAVNYGYYAGGGNPTGLFQYLPETWARYQRKLGVSGFDIWNYEHQAQLTAFAFSVGGAGEWACR